MASLWENFFPAGLILTSDNNSKPSSTNLASFRWFSSLLSSWSNHLTVLFLEYELYQ